MYDSDCMMENIENDLKSELGISELQAKAYLLVTCSGKMDASSIAECLGIPVPSAHDVATSLVDLGAFIEMSATEFEAMHPRFTAVNMLRRMCERQNKPFGRNKVIDAVGAALEPHYDSARTK